MRISDLRVVCDWCLQDGDLLKFNEQDTGPLIVAIQNLERAIMAGITLLQNAARNSQMEQALLNNQISRTEHEKGQQDQVTTAAQHRATAHVPECRR